MFFLDGSIQIVWRPDLFAIIHIFYKAETYGSAYCLSLQKNTCRSLWADVTCTVVHTLTHPNESHVTLVLILIIVDGVQHDAVAVFVVVDVDKAARGREGACAYSCHIK